MRENGKILVGDNPFHGISHLSQKGARGRGDTVTCAESAASLVVTSFENGANGFMFSVDEKTLSILRTIRETGKISALELHALVPYAYEYVREATRIGISGLAAKIAKQIIISRNLKAAIMGLKGISRMDAVDIMKTYVIYEISRVKSSAGKQANLRSLLLHEMITDMALALGLDWLFRSYSDFVSKLGIEPGFETRNFAYLVNKFSAWNIDFHKITIATPLNKIGFQMNPSRTECEKALAKLEESRVIAMSVLASGYLKPIEAIDYIFTLPNLGGLVVGVSKEYQARETFKLIERKLRGKTG
jgi:hypothetical protein